ncbi:MAG: hypothetical protein U0232_19560 [Thermomicrobiales bacterium]
MGVIDAIAEGCFAVARRPFVLLPLVLLDLVYWLGVRVSLDPLMAWPIAMLEWAQRQNTAADPTGQVGPNAADVASMAADLHTVGQQTDLLEILSIGQNPLLPKLTSASVGRPWGVGVLDLGSGWFTLVAMFGLLVVGLLWFALTLAVVATVVRDDPPTPVELARRVLRCWGRLIVLGLLLVAVSIFLGVPLLVLAGLLQFLGLNPGGPALLLLIPVLLALIFLSRTTDAMAVSDVGPLRSIKLSVTVVRHNFWMMFRLFAAGTLISFGFPIAWAFVARQTAGVPLAVVGNAFLNTGLLAAAMILYRERLAALEKPAATAGQQRQAPPSADPRDRR